MSPGDPSQPRRWRVLVPVVCLIAGFGFALSAGDPHSTDLRSASGVDLADVVDHAEARVHDLNVQVQSLQAQIDAVTATAGSSDERVNATTQRIAPLRAPGGLTAVHGAGLVVILDDAPDQIAGVDPNQLVVHQSDLQAVVNALWAGGAEAISIAGQRLVATSAVRCVGNTLLLNGEVYSPPFRVVAVGPATPMQAALTASPGVQLFLQAAEYYGLGYTVQTVDEIGVPAYTGSVGVSYARPVTK